MDNAVNQGGGVKTNTQQNNDNAGGGAGMAWAGYLATIVVALVDGALIILGYRAADQGKQLPPAIMIPAVGIITLLGVLAISNFFQGNKDLRNGQIRAAMAASILAVYFFVLALVMFTSASEKLAPIQDTKTPAVQITTDTGEETGTEDTTDTASSSTETAEPQQTGVAAVMESFTDLVKVVLLGYFAVRGVNEVTDTITSTVARVKDSQQGVPAAPAPTGAAGQNTEEIQNSPPPPPDRSQFAQT